MANKTYKLMRLFGVDTYVPETDSGGQPVEVLSPEECLTVQESEKGSEVSASGDDHVDTSLRLSCGSSAHVSRIGDQYEKKGKFPEGQLALSLGRVDVAGPTNNYIMHGMPVLSPTPLSSFPTTCTFFPCEYNESLSFSRGKPFQESNEKGTPNSGTDDGEVTPTGRGKTLKKSKKKEASQESNERPTKNSSSSRNNGESRGNSTRRRGQDDDKNGESVKRRKRSSIASHHTTDPIPVIEQNPGLLQVIESENGTRPLFLYRKKLQESDIRKDQNRIFLTKSEELIKFLTEEERNSVYNTKEGLELCVVDPEANSYTLHLSIWGSLHMPVLKSQWTKLVQRNNVQRGFWVEIWGFRCNGKARLAINFRKPAGEPEAHRDEDPNGFLDGGSGAI